MQRDTISDSILKESFLSDQISTLEQQPIRECIWKPFPEPWCFKLNTPEMDFPNGIPSSCMEIFLSIIIIKSSVFRSVNSAKIRSLRHPLYCIPVPWKYVFRISCIKRNNPYKPMTVIPLGMQLWNEYCSDQCFITLVVPRYVKNWATSF